MDLIAIISNSEIIAKDIVESFKIIADVRFTNSIVVDQALAFIREEFPQLIFIGEDLTMNEIAQFHKNVKADTMVEAIPIVFLCQQWKASTMDWMVKAGLVDEWIALDQTMNERLFRLNRQLEIASMMKDYRQLKLNHEYVSSELVYYVRSEQKEKRKMDKEQLLELIDIMHYVRTYLTGIMGGYSIVKSPDSSDDQKKEALEIIGKNITKMDDYINKNDLTVNNEFRKKPPIKIMKLSQIIEAISPKIYIIAQKKKLSVVFEKSERDHSILMRHSEILPSIRSALLCFINSSSMGSTVEIGLEALTSANLMRVYTRNLTGKVDMLSLHHYLDEGYEWLSALNDAEAKFELFSDSLFSGIQFYLPRLD
jgi:hypothetical protein